MDTGGETEATETLRRRHTGQEMEHTQRRMSFEDRLRETVLRRSSTDYKERIPGGYSLEELRDINEKRDSKAEKTATMEEKPNPTLLAEGGAKTKERDQEAELNAAMSDKIVPVADKSPELKSSKDAEALSPTTIEIPKPAENVSEPFPIATIKPRSSSDGGLLIEPASSNLASPPAQASDSQEKEKTVLVTPIGTSFDVADAKRNADFHLLFPDLDKNERLIEDYTCSWVGDMLVHGRMYITDSSLCFNAKVIWTYSVVIPFTTIKLVEKRTFAGIFPNALEVSTNEKKYYFASFLSRNQCFVQVTEILLGYPQNTIKSVPASTVVPSLTRQPSIAAELPRRRVISQPAAQGKSTASLRTLSMSKPEGLADFMREESLSGTSSPDHIIHQKLQVNPPTAEELDKREIPKPEKFDPFECDCMPIHLSQKMILDRTLPFELIELFQLIYNKNDFTLDYLKIQKYENIGISNWMPSDHKFTKEDLNTTLLKELPKNQARRRQEYIIPVNNPLGPKQSKCIVIEHITALSSKFLKLIDKFV